MEYGGKRIMIIYGGNDGGPGAVKEMDFPGEEGV
tara:strand:- start:9 stop:110 length:102 start_codon:yes stop_codon:yes gene_type:complete